MSLWICKTHIISKFSKLRLNSVLGDKIGKILSAEIESMSGAGGLNAEMNRIKLSLDDGSSTSVVCKKVMMLVTKINIGGIKKLI